MNTFTRLFTAASTSAILAISLSACATKTIDERLQYWSAETSRHLKVGSPRSEVASFFKIRGADLQCCIKESPSRKWHYIREAEIGYVLWTRYDVVVLVEFTSNDLLKSISVQRWGVGL